MKNIDIYGEPVEILINKKHYIRTTIGGFFTILTIFLVLTFTWFIGKDIVFKENPISYQQNYIFEKYLNFNITNNNFPFAFVLTDDNNIPLFDDSYLKIKLYYYNYGINISNDQYQLMGKEEIPLKPCNYSDFPNITKKAFDDAQLSFTFCPMNFNFNLKGYWNEEIISFLQISIERCKNSSLLQIEIIDNQNNSRNNNDSNISHENNSNIHDSNSQENNLNPICHSTEQMRNYISNTSTNLNIYYIDTKVMINNNEKPIEYLTKSSYKYLIPDYSKKTIFEIQPHTVNTDDGFIFESTNKVSFLKMIEDFTDISMISNELEQLIVFEIYSSNNSLIYFRRYVKVSDILASMGGMLKVFSVVFFYLNIVFSKVQKYVSIINEVFILNKKKINQQENLQEVNISKNFNLLNKENLNFNYWSAAGDLKKNREESNNNFNNVKNNKNYNSNNEFKSNAACEFKNEEHLIKRLNSNENNYSKNLLLLNDNNNNNFLCIKKQEKLYFAENEYSKASALENKSKLNEIEKNKLLIKCSSQKPNSNSNLVIKKSSKKKKPPPPKILINNKSFDENIEEIQNIKTKKTIKNNEKENQKAHICVSNVENSNFKPAISEIQSNLDRERNSKLNNQITEYPNFYKFLNLRKNKEKIEFSFKNIFRIICISYCKAKIPEHLKENYLFFKKGKESVNNYFDLVYMIKKFEEIKIMKNCILNTHQLNMLELLNKPILTINSNDIVQKINSDKTKRWIKINNESNDYAMHVDEFLKNVAINNNNIDMNIITLMHQYDNI